MLNKLYLVTIALTLAFIPIDMVIIGYGSTALLNDSTGIKSLSLWTLLYILFYTVSISSSFSSAIHFIKNYKSDEELNIANVSRSSPTYPVSFVNSLFGLILLIVSIPIYRYNDDTSSDLWNYFSKMFIYNWVLFVFTLCFSCSSACYIAIRDDCQRPIDTESQVK